MRKGLNLNRKPPELAWKGTVILSLGLATALCLAQEEDELIAELERMLKDETWEHSVEGTARGGYKDNLLLSPFNPEESGFVGGGLEGVVHRTFVDGLRLDAIATMDYRFYPLAEQLDHEATAFASIQLQDRFRPPWLWQLGADYLYQDQVVDVSATEVDLRVIRLIGHVVTLRPALQFQLGHGAHFEIGASAERDWYASPLDNVWLAGGGIRFVKAVGAGGEWSVGYNYLYQRHDDEPARTEAGLEIPGSQREDGYHSLRAVWDAHWDKARRWTTRVQVDGGIHQDPAAGYFDRQQIGIRARIRYRPRRWNFEVSPRWAASYYPAQSVSVTDPTTRQRREWSLDARAQWYWTSRLSLVAEFRHEETDANRPEEEYAVNTTSLGVNYGY